MCELSDRVIDAHGGIARWNKVKTIEGDLSITGGTAIPDPVFVAIDIAKLSFA